MRTRQASLILLLVLLFVTGRQLYAQSFYFTDLLLTTLQQLDQAFAEGEISAEDYEALREVFFRDAGGDREKYTDLLTPQLKDELYKLARYPLRCKYHGSFIQDLEAGKSLVRYDRLKLRWRQFRFDLSAQERGDGRYIIRSRSLSYNWDQNYVVLGSYDLKLGHGLTQGHANYQSELKRIDDFVGSLTQPIKNRQNGLLFRHNHDAWKTTVYVSRTAGELHTKDIYGAAFRLGETRTIMGLIGLRQMITDENDRSVARNFIAPHFRYSRKRFQIAGESSFGLKAGSAHLYEFKWYERRGEIAARVFSYGRSYQNLQSG
ncbi:MAG: hypothetical protein KAT58_08730, partial [candidate division Zixibacteria bacterium]|nr:hypothetical protein [candidate division Zixibacteria bacterium]